MKWEGNRQSENVEDRRSQGPTMGGRGFGGGRSIGLGTIVIALLAGWIFGINPFALLGALGGGAPGTAVVQPAPAGPAPSGCAFPRPGLPGCGAAGWPQRWVAMRRST